MFERYTEKARRVVYLARQEAGKTGSDYIEPEHLLLSLMREDSALLPRFLPQGTDSEAFRSEVQRAIPSRPPKEAKDMPLSLPTKRVLAYGAEEAERMNLRKIGTEHLVLGFLRDASRASRILEKYGVDLAQARHKVLEDSKAPVREAGGGAPLRQTVGREQFSSTRAEDGTVTMETHRFHESHEITLIERLKLSDDGKTLQYSQEVRGPKNKGHRFTLDFDVS
jgi:ATP-dependent Clp protease ATP-binding subunit ClpC